MTTQTPAPVPTSTEPDKKWYYSKTIWVNIITAIALILAAQTGFIIGQDEQAAILLVINIILRAISRGNLSW